jgi:hypothetical protein
MFLDQIKENTSSTSAVSVASNGINTIWGFDFVHQNGVQPVILVLE